MTAKESVWNYAVIRFLPYPEREEFVNLGVVVACPETGEFDFRMETERDSRVLHFFPALSPNLLSTAREMFLRELERVRECVSRKSGPASPSAPTRGEFDRIFNELVRPRESVLRFSGIGTLLARNSKDAMDALFESHVRQETEYRPAPPRQLAIAESRDG